jgi:hypothetical protein
MKLQVRYRHSIPCLLYSWVCVKGLIDIEAIYKIIHNWRYVQYSAKPVIEWKSGFLLGYDRGCVPQIKRNKGKQNNQNPSDEN